MMISSSCPADARSILSRHEPGGMTSRSQVTNADQEMKNEDRLMGRRRRRRVLGTAGTILCTIALATAAIAVLGIGRSDGGSQQWREFVIDHQPRRYLFLTEEGNTERQDSATQIPYNSDGNPTTSTTTTPTTTTTTTKKRTHKHLHPLDKTDIYGFTFATLGLIIAAGGGIGGGGLLVPIFILVMGFNPKHAIPLSNVTVFGGAVANTILNARKRHPMVDRPLVDWDLILIMEPLTIGGALIGAFLNKMLPETVLVTLLVALLSFTSYKTLKKASKMYRKETVALARQEKESELTRLVYREEDEDEVEAGESLLGHMEERGDEDEDEEGAEETSKSSSRRGTTTEEEEEEMDGKEYETSCPYEEGGGGQHEEEGGLTNEQQYLRRKCQSILDEEVGVPLGNIFVLVAMFLVVLFINLMKGGGAFPSPLGIQCGSTSFWIANVIMLTWIIFIAILCRAYLVHRYRMKERVKYPYVEGDIKWDERATVVYPLICCLSGFVAGMFGIGGGIIKGPLMLAMGVHPEVSSASSACMILFTSFTATTSYIAFGLLVPDYAPICLVIGFVATIGGQIGLSYLMKRYQRNSYIAFSIGAVVLLSAFLMTVQSLVSMAEGGDAPKGGICGSGSAEED